MAPSTIPTHLNIVALETFFTPLPPLTLPPPHTLSLTSYERTSPTEIPSRIKDANILITTTLPLSAEALSEQTCPNLHLIIVLASGTDSINLETCKARGIRVLRSPDCNSDAVAEHTITLCFAVRRSIVPTMAGPLGGEWPRKGSLMRETYQAGKPPRSCRGEVVVIVGYGSVGKKVAKLCAALGMTVQIAGRKGELAKAGRVPFDEALRSASVVVLCCPKTDETVDLISTQELSRMRQDAVLINVSRSGIVDEVALLDALKTCQIAGAGVDVFENEPASRQNCPLLSEGVDGLKLVVTPHTAWIGQDSTANYQRMLQEDLNDFVRGELRPKRVSA